MRGKLSDQDLTDYALNELRADDRMYVESMLACSEECREDVYQMLDMSALLKEGFEMEEAKDEMLLNEEQRSKVMEIPRWNFRPFLQKAAAVLVFAAGIGFMFTRPSTWQQGGAADKIATASQSVGTQMQVMVADFQQNGMADSVSGSLEEFTTRLEAANSDWQFMAQPAVCTPPMAEAMAEFSEIVEM